MEFLLLVTILLPLAGVAVIWASAEGGQQTARVVALATTVGTLLLAGYLVWGYPAGASDAYVSNYRWLGSAAAGWDIRLSLGLDGLSVWLFGLTALLMLPAVLVSWEAVTDRAPAFYCLLLLLETGMLGVFAARDIILFYIFFEFTLIPLFFLIGIWGSEERRHAANKFFLYTFAGSLLTFLSLLAIVWWNYDHAGALTFNIPELLVGLGQHPIDPRLQLLLFVGLFAGFAIKVPLFPLHTWLPLAHVQAPTAGSVILAGILLKIGTYGFVRFNLSMLPDASVRCMPWLLWLSAAGIIYGALVALVQTDMKRLVAYSSVSHLGYCMLGLFAINTLGMEGGVLQMINHGLSTGGLFAIVGMIYERYHTREIRQFGGLARRTPLLALFMLIFTFSSIGVPGLNGFAGEFLILIGMFQRAWAQPLAGFDWQMKVVSFLGVFGIILGAWYLLWLVQRIFFGPLREPEQHGHHHPVRDMSAREVLALAPLVVFIFWIGLAPRHFLDRMQPTLNPIVQRVAQHVPDATRAPVESAPVETAANPNLPAADSSPVEMSGGLTRADVD
jgi:NADH-quinone oxidoreductase subunit M